MEIRAGEERSGGNDIGGGNGARVIHVWEERSDKNGTDWTGNRKVS